MSLIESMTRRMTETGGGVTFAPTDLAGTAPALRDTLTASGVEIQGTSDGPRWRLVESALPGGPA